MKNKLEYKLEDLMKNINSLKLMTVSRLDTELNSNKKVKEEIHSFEYEID